MGSIRVVIADDHAVVRAGLRELLEKPPGISVIGEAESGTQALQLVEELNPDVLVLDIEMPDMSGIEVARSLNGNPATTSILALSVHDDREHVLEMLNAGVAGYLTKDEAPEGIVDAVRGIARGERGWLSRSIAQRMAAWQVRDLARTELTARERQVLGLVVAGRTNQEIGGELGITEKTVEKHLSSIFSKLHVESRVEAAVLAVREGLI